MQRTSACDRARTLLRGHMGIHTRPPKRTHNAIINSIKKKDICTQGHMYSFVDLSCCLSLKIMQLLRVVVCLFQAFRKKTLFRLFLSIQACCSTTPIREDVSDNIKEAVSAAYQIKKCYNIIPRQSRLLHSTARKIFFTTGRQSRRLPGVDTAAS